MAKKIAVIGAGGKITTAVMLELAVSEREMPLYFAMAGRNAAKKAQTKALVGANAADNVCMEEVSLDEALDGADIILYCASYGFESCGEWKSMGVYNGAHLMDIAGRMTKLCPEAWLLVVTNPPDVPLGAIARKYGLRRLIGLCNASVFTRKVLSAWLGCDENELALRDLGINHELWYTEILRGGESIYDMLREKLPGYTRDQADSVFLRKFPEWNTGFENNVRMLQQTGWLSAPVGGSARYPGSRAVKSDMSAVMKRPTAKDYEVLRADMTLEQLYATTRRCAAEFPIYIADVIRSLLYDDGKSHSVQVLNEDAFPMFPAEAMIQRSVRLTSRGWENDETPVPDFVRAAMLTRVEQSILVMQALADQDSSALRRAVMLTPERIDPEKLEEWLGKVLEGAGSVEPEIVLN